MQQTLTLLAHLSGGPHIHVEETAAYLIAALALVTLCLSWRKTT